MRQTPVQWVSAPPLLLVCEFNFFSPHSKKTPFQHLLCLLVLPLHLSRLTPSTRRLHDVMET